MKRFIAVLVVLLMAFGSISFAIAFKDVSPSFWGYTYINEVADKGIVTGYADGSFKPDESISKFASIVMIYRALEASNLVPTASLGSYRTKHSLTLSTYEVPDWVDLRDAVAYFLEVNVLSVADLKNFTDLGKLQNASRQDVAIFLGRALNLHLRISTTQISNLNFKDATLISNAAKPYVDILNKQQIVSGDTAGYFKPHDPVTRAQMAKMVSQSLKTLASQGQTEEKLAVVRLKLADSKKVVFYNQSDSTLTYIEKIEAPVRILSGTTEKTFNDLAIDQVVKLIYQGNTLLRVEYVNTAQTLNGEIISLVNLSDKVILSVKMANDSKSFIVYGTTPVTQNGLPDSYLNLMMGYTVAVTMNGDDVIKLDYQKSSSSYDGIVVEAVTVVSVPVIKIRVGQETKTFEFADNAIFKRNDSVVGMSNYIAGDVVTFKVSLGKITEINAISTKATTSGTIQEITISAKPIIKIINEDGGIESYTVSDQTSVKLDDKTVTLYDLRAGYSIAAKIESNQITSISAYSVTKKANVIGTIVNVYPDLNIFTIKDEAGVTHTVHVQDETLFLTYRGLKDDLDVVDKDDYFFVYGTFQDSFMVAETVLELR